MPPTLTIVGASARAAAASARRAGWTVHAADLFADADLTLLGQVEKIDQYPRELERAITGPQGGSWIYTGALENYPQLIDRWSQLRPLWGNSGEVLRGVRDPLWVAARLTAAGLSVARVQTDAARVPADGTWLRKPLASAAGMRIAPWHGPSSAVTHHASAGLADYYYQQFIPGVPAAAIYLAAGGGAAQLLGVTRQILGSVGTVPSAASEFQYSGSIGPLRLASTLRWQFERIGAALAADFQLVGLFGVDVVLSGHEIWAIEVNPRYTASIEILERCHGFNSLELHHQAYSHGVLALRTSWLDVPAETCWGKAIVFAEIDSVAPSSFAELAALSAGTPFPAVADIPAPGTPIAAGWPIATVFAQAADHDQTLACLRQSAIKLQRQCLQETAKKRTLPN